MKRNKIFKKIKKVPIPKLELWDLVEIFWIDVLSQVTQEWSELKDVNFNEWKAEMEHISCGYFIFEDSDTIGICQSKKVKQAHMQDDEVNVCGIWTFPKKYIISIKKKR